MAELSDLERLDASILAAITAAGGGPVRWAEIREQLPDRYRPWQVITALCRLKAEGRIDADKVCGATIVATAP